MALTTYPGTVTPLRGLAPFVESERDVLFGRDADRDAVTKLITQEGVRAGLLFGEPGVGKTSLLRAGLAPHLRDHGVVALACDDLSAPTESFARAVAAAGSLPAKAGEKAVDYLARVSAQAMQGQLYVFIVDDVDVALRADSEGRLAHELGDLFARVATRSGGRAKFLFATADARMHWLDALERRTGSLFPPPARYRLGRFAAEQAIQVLERTLALANISTDPGLARAVGEALAQAGPVLPADVQIAARAVRDLQVGTSAALARLGGAAELQQRWIEAAAAATGDERGGMRLLAELATGDDAGPVAPEAAGARAGVAPDAAARALAALTARGVCVAVPMPEGGGTWYALAHEVLVPRIRELAAPAREGAKRARARLEAAAARGARLSFVEARQVRQEGIAPTTPAEERALRGAKRLIVTAIAAAAAAPIVFLIIMYALLAGTYHLSIEGEGANQRVVARAGRPSLSAFYWLPHDPPFGSVVADSGFTAAMVAPEAWKQVRSGSLGGDLDGKKDDRRAFVAQSLQALRPELRGLVTYVLRPDDDRALEDLQKGVAGPEDLVRLLSLLAPVARGGPAEVQLVAAALGDASPSVQRAALELAAAVARRRPGSYHEVIARAMAASDPELRRLAFATARSLGPQAEGELVAAALGMKPDADARQELLTALAGQATAKPAVAATAAVAILAGPGDEATRDRAWQMLERAFDRDAAEGARAAAKLAADANAPPEARVRALRLLEERAPKELSTELAPEIEAAVNAESVEVRAAALPLFARVAPDEAARKLVSLQDPPPPVRAAQAAAWGEVARVRADAAQGALDLLLEDKVPSVRAAAARAYGRLGRAAQEKLVKLCKDAGGDIAEGAAYGLAASVEAGAPVGEAVTGLGHLWKKKGGARRVAARVYARLARTKPGTALPWLASASREKEDAVLRAIGVDGLCNTLPGQAKQAAGPLKAAAEDEVREVRARVAACVAARPDSGNEAILKVALKLADDGDAEIRLDAARSLAATVQKGKAPRGVAPTLARLAGDADRRVRAAAAAGVRELGTGAPKELTPALRSAWGKADEAEKLVLVEVAQAVGEEAIVKLAAGDAAPSVRTRALGAAVALRVDVAAILGGALTDGDPGVRREALRLVGDPQSGLPASDAVQALEVAVGDRDPAVAEAALYALAGVDEPARVAARLGADLTSPSEQARARAARAAAGLAARDPKAAAALLEPLLHDPAHDVRAAVIPALAAAYVGAKSTDDLAKLLGKAERDAVARLVAIDALYLAARADRRAEVESALAPLAQKGPPFAQLGAQLVLGLLASDADGVAFVALLVP